MSRRTRREFLGTTVCGLAGLAWRVRAESSVPCAASAWQKHGIVLEPTELWEEGNVQNFTTMSEPLGEGRWRIWYSVSGSRESYTLAYAEGRPGEVMAKVPARCSPGAPDRTVAFAIGNLPEKWRPVQVSHVRLPNGKHRIYFWVHGPGVARYLAAESEDGKAYQVVDHLRPVLYHPNDRAARGVPSPDGVMFGKGSGERPGNEPKAEPHLISNDATTMYQQSDGSFVMYSVALVPVRKDDPAYMPHDNAPGLVRVIDRYTSADGLRFENRERVVQRDEKDPADQQFYHLAATPTEKGYVGMLGHYRCEAQTMDLEWCFSPDGLRWERPLRGAWLRRGKPPEADCYGIYPGNSLVREGGRWHLFYTGVNSSHNGKQSYGRPRQVIMLATTEDIWAA